MGKRLMWIIPRKTEKPEQGMANPSNNSRIRSDVGRNGRSGFSYVAVLILVAVLSSVALSFINRVGVSASSSAHHFEQVQAEYYARAAANHAMWALLNYGTFPPDEDVYYIRDFEDGRYAYKTKRHTNDTFATVSAMGIVGETVAHASYVICIPPW